MKILFYIFIVFFLAIFGGCSDDGGSSCKLDKDCPEGSKCDQGSQTCVSISGGTDSEGTKPGNDKNTENPDSDSAVSTKWEDLDSDGDGIPNGMEKKEDSDGDGIPNFLDTDSDNDGISDSEETGGTGQIVDGDGDGFPDFIDDDSDNNGIKDGDERGTGETPRDSDGDGIPDFRDNDDDNDNISDAFELGTGDEPADTDGDGKPDYLDSDSDGDSIPDILEGSTDTDNDGIANYLDDDSDNDGLPDKLEVGPDPEKPLNSDTDVFPDYLDGDSDNDGLSDKDEDPNGNATVDNGETDRLLKDSDGDGFDDGIEVAAGSDPLIHDDQEQFWTDKYYVVLPYKEEETKELEFSTNIQNTDILFMVDLSGSMSGEIHNLRGTDGGGNVITDGSGNPVGINKIIDDISKEFASAGFGLITFDNLAVSTGGYNVITYVIDQYITTDRNKIEPAVKALNTTGGGSEPHIETLYQAATGEGFESYFKPTYSNDYSLTKFPVADCSSEEGSMGGACFRQGSLPIFIMLTDEQFDERNENGFAEAYEWKDGKRSHNLEEATEAMNRINAKFIGLDSSDGAYAMDNFNTVSGETGSIKAGTNPATYFNFNINSDGTGISGDIVDAVVDLTSNVPMDVSTATEKVVDTDVTDPGVNSTQFIAGITCASGGTCSSDNTTFLGVVPGASVKFNIEFKNDFYTEKARPSVFKAKINVLGESALLDSRDVWIIVPGKGSGLGS